MATIEFSYVPDEDTGFKKEGDGYWICCGALNAFNRANDFYVYDEKIKKLFFSKESRFGCLLTEGLLGGEAEHPDLSGLRSEYEINSRLLTIEPTRRSHNIKAVRFEECEEYSTTTSGKTGSGKIVKIYCLIVPLDNELGRTLRSMIESGSNVAFSIRTYAHDVMNTQTGIMESFIYNPITFDWVTRGGIGVATKDKTSRYYKNENDLVRGMKYDIKNLEKVSEPEEKTHRQENHEIVMEVVNKYKEEKQRERTTSRRGSLFLDNF